MNGGYIRKHPHFQLNDSIINLNTVHRSDQLVTLTAVTPPMQVRLVGITPDHGLLRTVPEDPRVARSQPYVDLQPDGNSFDMLTGLIQVK